MESNITNIKFLKKVTNLIINNNLLYNVQLNENHDGLNLQYVKNNLNNLYLSPSQSYSENQNDCYFDFSQLMADYQISNSEELAKKLNRIITDEKFVKSGGANKKFKLNPNKHNFNLLGKLTNNDYPFLFTLPNEFEQHKIFLQMETQQYGYKIFSPIVDYELKFYMFNDKHNILHVKYIFENGMTTYCEFVINVMKAQDLFIIDFLIAPHKSKQKLITDEMFENNVINNILFINSKMKDNEFFFRIDKRDESFIKGIELNINDIPITYTDFYNFIKPHCDFLKNVDTEKMALFFYNCLNYNINYSSIKNKMKENFKSDEQFASSDKVVLTNMIHTMETHVKCSYLLCQSFKNTIK